MSFFDIDNIFFTLLGYPVSYLEFFAVITGITAVFLSARANIWSWPIGVVNVVLYFFLFFQVQLYPDMFLQAFFLVTNLAGWWRWSHPRPGEEDRKRELRVSFMRSREIAFVVAATIVGTALLGLFARNLHNLLPSVFSAPSAMPFVDSFIAVLSVIVTFYMIQKKVESWIMWLIIDIVATWLYFIRDIKFTSALYFVFCLIAAYALFNWVREYRSYQPGGARRAAS
jgi:nicotinamide mononucleotide transporter